LVFVGRSRENLRDFPKPVRHQMGFALWLAERGNKHPAAKALKGFGGAGVLEMVSDYDGGTYHAVYTVKLTDMDLIRARLAEVLKESRQ
jgi:phage-related protein